MNSLDSEEFRSLVYSNSFAQRFNLPRAGVMAIEAGLQALVLRISDSSAVEDGAVSTCYLDDTADFAYPEGTEGDFNHIP